MGYSLPFTEPNVERNSLNLEMPGHDQSNSQQGSRNDLVDDIQSTGTLANGNGNKKDEILDGSYGGEFGTQQVDSSSLVGPLSNGSVNIFPCLNVPINSDPSQFKRQEIQLSDNLNGVHEFCKLSGATAKGNGLPSDSMYGEKELHSCLSDSSDLMGGVRCLINSDQCSQNREIFSSSRSTFHQLKKESGLSNFGKEHEVQGYDCTEDESVALWVKWRGKWQAGIRCSMADCPLATVKAKPTHERKKYIVVFFPHSRTHCWADMSLVCSINEFPEPLAFGTHCAGMEMVKDLRVPHRFMMQKLAVAMLNFSDHLHTESVIERGRNVAAWKDFAIEASRCQCYSDLGRMLVKLFSMILPAFVDPKWLEHSFGLWAQRCLEAKSAGSIETLKEELVDAVLWNEVDVLWDEKPIKSDLGSEWKTWKQEVMKWFSTSHPPIGVDGAELQSSDNITSACPQTSSRKRQKLEVRRPDLHTSQAETNSSELLPCNGVETDLKYFNGGHLTNVASTSKSCKDPFTRTGPIEDPEHVTDRWHDIVVVEDKNAELSTKEAVNEGGSVTKHFLDHRHVSRAENKYRQCVAFIEAKGRQCGRWANDGDIYCCVHLNQRLVERTNKGEQTPPSNNSMCEGMTNLGTRCKHRSLNGSSFCKKHQLQGSHNFLEMNKPLVSSGNDLKRKIEDSSETVSGKETVLIRDQSAIQVNANLHMIEEVSGEKECVMELFGHSGASSTHLVSSAQELQHCIVRCSLTNEQCLERGKLHTLYCEKHLPGWLKRVRHGKTRIISKNVFIDLLKSASSREKKLYLHQACELLYRFMKSALSRRNTVSKETLFDWILSEASKDINIAEYLLEVVLRERNKIGRLWGFISEKITETTVAPEPRFMPEANNKTGGNETAIKCKLCMEDFFDGNALGMHWMEAHKKEAQWLFRGFACAICSNSFTNRKVLELHIKEKHNIESLDECILFQCMPCGSHFMNPEHLWLHVLKLHGADFRQPTVSRLHNRPTNQGCQPKHAHTSKPSSNNKLSISGSVIRDNSKRFGCKLCGLKFDLLPDIGRHHQVAHMGLNSLSHFPPRKRGRGRPRIKDLGVEIGPTAMICSRPMTSVPNLGPTAMRLQNQSPEVTDLEQSEMSRCSDVAEILFPELQKTKPRPSNLEILSIAQSTCCKINFLAALEPKYGILPERLYLKAAKLCSELNIHVKWHLEGFVCPNGCRPLHHSSHLTTFLSLAHLEKSAETPTLHLTDSMTAEEWEMEECHYVLSSRHFQEENIRKCIVLCDDLSFGRESVLVPCVVDEDLNSSTLFCVDRKSSSTSSGSSVPWGAFTYITERMLDPSLDLSIKFPMFGCACLQSTCCSENCDHVYLFNNDFEDAEDMYGKPMHGRFAYNDDGKIILKEGNLVYECNSMCYCDRTCHNRVLQNGLQVKLEVFKTEKKGWGVRAGEAIARGAFVCEYVGEVLSVEEAKERNKRYINECCSYLYDFSAYIEQKSLDDAVVPYVIDATNYGNVSRFINHSCLPNLVVYQVLVESMDCRLLHVGFYAIRDIVIGEELTYYYHHKPPPGRESPCYCGASNCRGHL